MGILGGLERKGDIQSPNRRHHNQRHNIHFLAWGRHEREVQKTRFSNEEGIEAAIDTEACSAGNSTTDTKNHTQYCCYQIERKVFHCDLGFWDSSRIVSEIFLLGWRAPIRSTVGHSATELLSLGDGKTRAKNKPKTKQCPVPFENCETA